MSVIQMKNKDIYSVALNFTIAQLLQLIREAESDDEKSFYACLLNWHFQRKQRVAIDKNLF